MTVDAIRSRIDQIEARFSTLQAAARAVPVPAPVAGGFDAVLAQERSSAAVAQPAPAPAAGPAPVPAAGRAPLPTGGPAAARLAQVTGAPPELASLFVTAGADHGVDPYLLAAVASAESEFSTTAVSRAGAQGVMQLMPGTAKGLGVTDSFDPAQAVPAAAKMLAALRGQFGTVELALAGYNAGPGAVQRHGGIPPFPETRAYVPKVMGLFEQWSSQR